MAGGNPGGIARIAAGFPPAFLPIFGIPLGCRVSPSISVQIVVVVHRGSALVLEIDEWKVDTTGRMFWTIVIFPRELVVVHDKAITRKS